MFDHFVVWKCSCFVCVQKWLQTGLCLVCHDHRAPLSDVDVLWILDVQQEKPRRSWQNQASSLQHQGPADSKRKATSSQMSGAALSLLSSVLFYLSYPADHNGYLPRRRVRKIQLLCLHIFFLGNHPLPWNFCVRNFKVYKVLTLIFKSRPFSAAYFSKLNCLKWISKSTASDLLLHRAILDSHLSLMPYITRTCWFSF